jgi:hypothetical protein
MIFAKYIFIIFICKKVYPINRVKMGKNMQIMQIIKRKISNIKENNKGNKKSTK